VQIADEHAVHAAKRGVWAAFIATAWLIQHPTLWMFGLGFWFHGT
jgi:hypothetical protein